MNLTKTKFFNTDEVYISSKMNEYLKNNFGYEISGDLASLREAKVALEVTKAELKGEYMSKAYVENMLMIETIKSLLKAHGASGKTTIIKEDEVSDSVIAQKGNYTFRRTKSDIFHLEYKGTLIASGDYDSGSGSFWMDNQDDGEETPGQTSFDSGEDVIDYYIKHNITEPVNEEEYSDPDGEKYECMDCGHISSDWIEDDSIRSDADSEANMMLCPKCKSENYYTESKESVTEETIGQDEQSNISTEHYEVVVSANDLGIIVDIKDKNDNEIDSNQYWDEDVMGESTEAKESVTEDDEDEEKGIEHYRWKNDSQLSIALDKLEACMAQLDVAIEYRATNSHLFFNTGDKAGTGDLYRMKEQLEKLRDGWDESTELYGM